jgi:hypothetical protein
MLKDYFLNLNNKYMPAGYIYCFSNASMPDIFKIGITHECPLKLLKEANSNDKWRPPTPYKIELVKYVEAAEKKFIVFNSKEIIKNSGFFKLSLEEIRCYFDNFKGDWYSYEDDEILPIIYPLLDEEWRVFKSHRKYSVSNMGRVCLTGKNKLIEPEEDGRILTFDLAIYLDVLVAEVFIPNPEEKWFVKHINGNKDDNRASNLEWCEDRALNLFE